MSDNVGDAARRQRKHHLIPTVAAAASLGAMGMAQLAANASAEEIASKCTSFESEDARTGICVPTMPSGVVATTTAPGGGLPEVDGVSCTGSNT